MIVTQDICVSVLGLVLQGPSVMESTGRRPALDLGVLLVKAATAFQSDMLDELAKAKSGFVLGTEIR